MWEKCCWVGVAPIFCIVDVPWRMYQDKMCGRCVVGLSCTKTDGGGCVSRGCVRLTGLCLFQYILLDVLDGSRGVVSQCRVEWLCLLLYLVLDVDDVPRQMQGGGCREVALAPIFCIGCRWVMLAPIHSIGCG